MDIQSLRKMAASLDADLINEIAGKSEFMKLDSDIQLLDTGAYVQAVPFVMSGLIRVSRREQDKDMLLYYIHPGEVCIMSFSACCSNSVSMIVASTVEETSLLLLPSVELRRWLKEYPSLNNFIYSQYNTRYTDLMDTINQLIFNRLDERILHYLKEKTIILQDLSLSITHQQIANDLGTAREVVSRLMKKLERENKIVQGRNQVKLLTSSDQ